MVTHPFLLPRPTGLNFFVLSFLAFAMPGRLVCQNSLVAFFPASVYKSVGASEVLPALLDILPAREVLAVQFLRNGAVRITFKSADSCRQVCEDGLRYGEHELRLSPVEPSHVLVYLRDCPMELPNSDVAKVLGAYGVVHDISASSHEKFPAILNGTRVVKMSLSRDIPSTVRVSGFDGRVWYRRQPILCPICGKSGHRAKQCPLHGLCRRCKKPGHMARECRSAWGTAGQPAAPGSSDPPPAATPSAAPPVAPPVVPPVVPPVAVTVPADIVLPEDAGMDLDPDYVPSDVPDVPDSTDSDLESLASGDLEVAASSPSAPPSPRRTRSCAPVSSGPPATHADVPSGAPSGPPASGVLPSIAGVAEFSPAPASVVSPAPVVPVPPSVVGAAEPSPAPPSVVPPVCKRVYVNHTTWRLSLPASTKFAKRLEDGLGDNGLFDFGSCTRDVLTGARSLEERRVNSYNMVRNARPAIWMPCAQTDLLEPCEPSGFNKS